jgi:hypothetical protein
MFTFHEGMIFRACFSAETSAKRKIWNFPQKKQEKQEIPQKIPRKIIFCGKKQAPVGVKFHTWVQTCEKPTSEVLPLFASIETSFL